MRVSETFELSILDDGLDVDRLERYLAKEVERFRKRVFEKVLREIEAKKLEEAKGRVSCRVKVSLASSSTRSWGPEPVEAQATKV